MKRLIGAFAVVSLSLMGCGGSLCDDLADSDKDFYEKTKACSSFNDGTPYTEPTEAQLEQCEQQTKSCTDADKDKIRDFNSCVADLDKCTAATEQQFTNSFAGCALSHLANISDTCLSSVGEDSVRQGARLVNPR
ncbi:hypothetical protein [Hyalangium minutum]|uniref:Lipoprotein n=1 Tax=Hyalangium minutum TaxID=394096 RepID=A0A085WJ55_9BACT|nr:hypothetical protein [Hyalangium minutum]KFE67718.1 hypothetical protein DB31_8201 [Hyalangium minutum]